MYVFGIIPRQIDFSIIEGTKKGLENNRPSLLASVVRVSPSSRHFLYIAVYREYMQSCTSSILSDRWHINHPVSPVLGVHGILGDPTVLLCGFETFFEFTFQICH